MTAAAIQLGTEGNIVWGAGPKVGIAIGISLVWAIKNTMRVDH